jgi:hypothetical protein
MTPEQEPVRGGSDFETKVLEELAAIRAKLTTHGQSIMDHERTLYGHEDTRRRITEPGVVQVVGDLASAFKDVKAVAKAGWSMLGLVGFSTAVSLFSLFVRIN